MRWVQFGNQGWVRVNGLEDDSGDFVVHVKTMESEGRRLIVDLLVGGQPWAPGLTSATMKAIPIGWIESVINTPAALAALAERDDGDFKNDQTLNAFRERETEFIAEQVPYVTDELPKLTRPDGSDPDSFYRQVANAYAAAVTKTGRPAVLLAEEAAVPVPTVHRWIAESRRRGFLPPARKGRAG